MRVTAAARQHPLHLQVTRTNNGKFLVSPNNNQDISQQPTSDETNPVPAVVFPSYEPLPTDHHGPAILGDRYLLLGPAEGSALYRCVDVHSGQQLVAKVSFEHSTVSNRTIDWSRVLESLVSYRDFEYNRTEPDEIDYHK